MMFCATYFPTSKGKMMFYLDAKPGRKAEIRQQDHAAKERPAGYRAGRQ